MKNLTIVLICIFGFLLIMEPIINYDTQETITITVKEKDVVISGSGQNTKSKYLVFTEDEVFENTDCWIPFGKFNSSDFQRKLEVGKTYQVTVCGYRMPLVSGYRNIIKIIE